MLTEGLIIKVNSDTFTVKINYKYLDCKSRGKNRYEKIKPLVGDKVLVDEEKLVIDSVLERKNCLSRPPVANIDIALIVTSLIKPNLSLTLLDKLISIVTINNIEPVIIFTKTDLVNKSELKELNNLIKYYESIGIKVFINKKVRKIKKYIKNKIVTVCGQTGAGKSTLINKLDKNLNLETKEISESLGRGVHTTRVVELFEIDNFYIVDTPGFSSIDINNYNLDSIRNSFVEFRNLECKFKDCKHEKELVNKVIEEKNKGKILDSRYENYIRFIKE